jgi:hypothetical protein
MGFALRVVATRGFRGIKDAWDGGIWQHRQLFEAFNEHSIRFGEVIGMQGGNGHPITGDMLAKDQCPTTNLSPEGEEIDLKVLLFMPYVFEKVPHFYFPVELLSDFSLEALLQGFIRINLAAGKLPAEAEFLVGGALGDEEAATDGDESGSYLKASGFEDFHGTSGRSWNENDKWLSTLLPSDGVKVK